MVPCNGSDLMEQHEVYQFNWKGIRSRDLNVPLGCAHWNEQYDALGFTVPS